MQSIVKTKITLLKGGFLLWLWAVEFPSFMCRRLF